MTTEQLCNGTNSLNSSGNLMKVINVKETKKRKSHVVLSLKRWNQLSNYVKIIRPQLVKAESNYIFCNPIGKVQVRYCLLNSSK